MIAISGSEVARVVGGTLVDHADESIVVTGVARIDSRDAAAGDLFVAILGDAVDGHDFAGQARANGAVLSLAARPVEGPYVLVDDTVQALTSLARHNAQQLPNSCQVLAMTGSSGKTSTKDLLHAVLEANGETVAPPGSFNNEVGLPLTVLSAGPSTKYLVLEMGARGVGHIAWLCSIARPDVGIELNVGSAHISEFGDREAIAVAKGELVESLPATGTAVLNGDDALVRGMAARTSAEVVYFGSTADCLVRAEGIRIDALGRASFTLKTQGLDDAPVSLQISGRHHVSNALAAAAAALVVGLAPESIAEALSAATARSRWRMEVAGGEDGVTVINDAYNANPESMAAALRATADIAQGRRIGLVLGDMLELGALSVQAHREVGTMAAKIGAAWIVSVGPFAETIGSGFTGQVGEVDLVHVGSAPEAVAAARRLVDRGDVVLVKASRAIGLEIVAAALLKIDGTDAESTGGPE